MTQLIRPFDMIESLVVYFVANLVEVDLLLKVATSFYFLSSFLFVPLGKENGWIK